MSSGGGFFQRLKHEKWAFAIALGLSILMKFVEFQGWLLPTEGRIFDLSQRFTEGSTDADRTIAAVLIDDEDYANCFQFTSPLKPDRVARLVAEFAGAPVVGIDILTADPKYGAQANPQGDNLVWAAEGLEPAQVKVTFFAWLVGGEDHFTVAAGDVLGQSVQPEVDIPKVKWALPLYPRDEDLRVRRFGREVEVRDSRYPLKKPYARASWAKAIAELACKNGGCKKAPLPGWTQWLAAQGEETGEVAISFDRPGPVERRVSEFFDCSGGRFVPNGAAKAMTGSHDIILIGGTYGAARDDYETAVGRKAGMLVSAAAIRAEMENRVIREIPRLRTLVMDVSLGFVMVLLAVLFPPSKDPARSILRRSGVLVLLSIVVSWRLMVLGYIWFSWIGVAAGTVIGILVDIWRLNPQQNPGRKSGA